MDKLVQQLKRRGVLKSGDVEQALRAVNRADFVPAELRESAYDDEPLPLGFGQTISQPYTVVFMLELLQVEHGQTIIDVGAGSGWQTALLAHLVGQSGQVHALEIVPALTQLAENNLKQYPELQKRVAFYKQSAAHLPDHLMKNGFDRLIAAAALSEATPLDWRTGLRPGGRLVYPRGRSIILEVKDENEQFSSQEFPGFVFVPFVEN